MEKKFARSFIIHESIIGKEDGSVIRFNDLFESKTDEEGYQWRKFRDQSNGFTPFVHCACGYRGKAIVGRLPMNAIPVQPAFASYADEQPTVLIPVEDTEFKPMDCDWIPHNVKFISRFQQYGYACPDCGNQEFIEMQELNHKPREFVDYVKFYDNGHKLTLAVGVAEYYYNVKTTGEKIGYKKSRYRLTFNSETGFLYLVKGRKIRNITYTKDQGDLWALDNLLRYQSKDNPEYEVAFKTWLNTILVSRGVKYKSLDNMHSGFSGRQNHMLNFFNITIREVLVFALNPELQNLPFSAYYFNDDRNEELKRSMKALRKLTEGRNSAAELFEAFTGRSEKSIRKNCTTATQFMALAKWAPVASDVNILSRLLKESARGEQTEQVGIELLLGEINYITAKEAIKWFRSLHSSEVTMLNALLRCKVQRRVYPNQEVVEYRGRHNAPFDDPFAPQAVAEANIQWEEVFDLRNAEQLIADAYRQYEHITDVNPEYQLTYDGNLREMHDTLSRDYRRYRTHNLEIPYSEREKERFNRTVGGLEFKLPKQTWELVDVGAEMDICVGSYGDRAVAKSLNIVVAYAPGNTNPIVCLEIAQTGGLAQAKTHRNRIPDAELAKVVADYCLEANVNPNDSDMRNIRHLLETPAYDILPERLPTRSEILGADTDGDTTPTFDYRPRHPQMQRAEAFIPHNAVGDDDLPF